MAAFVVAPADAGFRLDRFLAQRWPELSRSRLSQLVAEAHVTVDGHPAKPALRLKAGQQVALSIPPPEPATPQPEALALSILFEDADVVVVDKPAGMVVHPAAGVRSGTLVNALLHHVSDLGGVGGELRPGIVHRLDKDTSGCLVVAKNDTALFRLQQAFQAREVDKLYLAIVHGQPPDQGLIDTPFGRHPTDRVRMTGKFAKGERTRRAITRFTTAERFAAGAARVDVELETGRTHQIRVHLSEAGHPLLGDATYGGTRRERQASEPVREAARAIGRQALHARALAFPHPRTGARIECEAPLPPELARGLAILRAAGVVAAQG